MLCSGLFCSVIVLDVNKIDVKYNKRISKYRDNDDKNGWWMKRNERKNVSEMDRDERRERAKECTRAHTHERKRTDIQIQYTVSDRSETKGNLTMNNSSSSNNNNRNIKIPSLSRLEQWHLFYSAWDDREFAARMTKFKYNNVHDERRNKFTCDASSKSTLLCILISRMMTKKRKSEEEEVTGWLTPHFMPKTILNCCV